MQECAYEWLGYSFYSDQWQLLGDDKPSKHWAIRFPNGGSRATEKALDLLKDEKGQWQPLYALDHEGHQVRIFAGPDKSRKQIRLEVATKNVVRELDGAIAGKVWHGIRSKGIVQCDGVDVMQLDVAQQRQDPAMLWKHKNLQKVSVDKEAIAAVARRSFHGRASDEDEWCS